MDSGSFTQRFHVEDEVLPLLSRELFSRHDATVLRGSVYHNSPFCSPWSPNGLIAMGRLRVSTFGLSMVHCSVPQVLCDSDFHPTHTRCTYARSPRLCFERFCRASGVLGGLRLTLAFWRTRRMLMLVRLSSIFIFLLFSLLRESHDPLPRCTNMVFDLPIACFSTLLGSALNLWESFYQHHSQFPSTSCQHSLASIQYRTISTSYLFSYGITYHHVRFFSMSNRPQIPLQHQLEPYQTKKKKFGGALRCEGSR